VCGHSGTGKAEFAAKLASKHNWKHIDFDKGISEGKQSYEMVKEIPDENFVVANWTTVPNDLNIVAEILINKTFSCLILSAELETINKNLMAAKFGKKYITSKKRIDAEKEAVELTIWLFSNVARIMKSEYYDPEGNPKEDFMDYINTYYINKMANRNMDTTNPNEVK
jgi:dephospho-CoA kinase